MHETAELPTGNVLPLAGVQVVAMGDAPYATDGVPYTTLMGAPDGDVTVTGAGQVMTGGSIVGGGGVGVVGELQPPAAINAIERHHAHGGRTEERKLCTNDSKDGRKSVRGGPSLPRPSGPVPHTRDQRHLREAG